ncbi:MAG TPA: elongation factor G [Methylomusa anaerophila]|uniref:Elongation factor G n=1 Tax=Methylomusa anaerophila TaxID=1930071 RepID=A0A348APJ6_9FIRM|nr:elongation factor G [Methylomusa anaerophila]BBB92994.1 elongation factor G [Methylomusa anaerophila]HML87173.1 elongation factor G [Methylomusa anaerophila]
MKEYKSDKLRNVGIVSHGGAGKTSLTEALLFNSGAVSRLGRVDDGSTTTDFEPEEVKRKVTISTALAPCEWHENKINFLDTPGYADFAAEVKSSLQAADSALVVLCAAAGVEVETEKVWQYAADLNLPRIAFINKMDRENADFYSVVDTMKEKFGNGIVPIQLPIGAQDTFKGIIDLIKMKALIPANNQGAQYSETDIPADMEAKAGEARTALIEAAAESDDDLLTKYLDSGELTDEEIKTGLITGIYQAKVFPVLCGSAYKNIGAVQVLDAIVSYLPAPGFRTFTGFHPSTKDPVERKISDPFSAMVFKTTADPFVGRLSFIRVFSGTLKPDSTLYNISKDKSERIGNIFSMKGKNQDPMAIAHAGDIVVVAKMQETGTGESLCDREKPVMFEPVAFPKPMFTRAIEAKNKGDEDKIGNALTRLMDEDPTFKTRKDVETHQLLISGMGELHLDIMVERMKRKFSVDALLHAPKVPYRETIRSSVKVEGKHKKQSGGHGQYGHVWLQLDPLAPGAEFEFVDSIFGGAVPRQYIPAVEKGVRDAMAGGILAGYPMVDVKVTLCDGSYHTVDSSEMAFKIASAMALKKGVLQAKPVLLEPIYSVEVIVPESYMGDVIGDLNTKRGRIQGMEPLERGLGRVKAQVPLSELFRYSIDLRSITQGRGNFDMNFSHYEEVPQKIAENIIVNAKKDKVEEA